MRRVCTIPTRTTSVAGTCVVGRGGEGREVWWSRWQAAVRVVVMHVYMNVIALLNVRRPTDDQHLSAAHHVDGQHLKSVGDIVLVDADLVEPESGVSTLLRLELVRDRWW